MISLADHTTLGVGGPARRFVRVEHVVELRKALAEAESRGEAVLVLGGGSNRLVGDAGWPGVVIQLGIMGIEIDDPYVAVGAGIVWDDFVAQMVEAGRAGIECLSGIPGLVGATPMQNVGAYGQEVADTIVRVHALDRQTGQLVDFTNEQCQFAYRSSMFKGNARYIIVEVEFELPKSERSKPLTYAELTKSLGAERAPLRDVRERVIQLRRGKGMVVDASDPDSRSAGSFFMNPIVDAAAVEALATKVAAGTAIPQWAQPDGRVKLSAGWLIERAGFVKGYTRGRAGISSKHALALVNRGGATAEEVLALAREIQDGVRTTLGIELHPEPVIV